MDNQIISSVIQASGAIIATVIAATTAAIIGKKFQNQEKLKDKLKETREDIAFLLAVESEHVEKNKIKNEEGHKNKIREEVRNKGFKWSGNNTPGRLRNG